MIKLMNYWWKEIPKNKRHRIQNESHNGYPMTVCLAVIAEMYTDSPKIIFASDKLVEAGVCFESGIPKIKELTRYAYVAISSNNSLISDFLITKLQTRIKSAIDSGEQPTIDQIIEWLSNECKNRLKSEREKGILFGYDLNYDEFKNRSKDLHENIVDDVIDKLNRFQDPFETSFLVVCIDDNKPHIYTVDQNGNAYPWNSIGFATIGEGAFLAHSEITKYPYDPNITLDEAVVLVYNAKKMAGRMLGVGEKTDLAVLYLNENREVCLWEINGEYKSSFDLEIVEMRKKEMESYVNMRKKFIDILKGRQESQQNETK